MNTSKNVNTNPSYEFKQILPSVPCWLSGMLWLVGVYGLFTFLWIGFGKYVSVLVHEVGHYLAGLMIGLDGHIHLFPSSHPTAAGIYTYDPNTLVDSSSMVFMLSAGMIAETIASIVFIILVVKFYKFLNKNVPYSPWKFYSGFPQILPKLTIGIVLIFLFYSFQGNLVPNAETKNDGYLIQQVLSNTSTPANHLN